MFASAADSSSQRYLSADTRVGKLSAGIQLAPLPKTGTPFTTNAKLCPHSSLSRRTSSERIPVLTDLSSTVLPPIMRRARKVYIDWVPNPLGHHRVGLSITKSCEIF